MDRRPEFPFARPEQELGRAWALVAAGDLPGARDVLLTAAQLAATTGYRITEAWLLHDVARLGDPASVADRLAELEPACEGDLVAAYAGHAAASGGRPARSCWSRRAIASNDSALGCSPPRRRPRRRRRSRRHGDGRAAAAIGARAAALAESCEGARTPGLSSVVTVVPLTARERDIATLAAQGESSKAIAAQLFLSVRTVNNHLQNVYSKLGVTGRGQLAGALKPAGVSPDGDTFERARHHRLRGEVVGERPRLLDVGGPTITERRGQRRHQRLTHQPVVARPGAVAAVAGAERLGRRAERVELLDRPDEGRQLGGEPRPLDARDRS